MKKTDRLKFPQIASLLYELLLDIGEWKPQVEQRVGLGIWTFNAIKKTVSSHLKEFSLLLAQVNGIKLDKDEKEEYKQYEEFSLKMNAILRNAKRRAI